MKDLFKDERNVIDIFPMKQTYINFNKLHMLQIQLIIFASINLVWYIDMLIYSINLICAPSVIILHTYVYPIFSIVMKDTFSS